MPTARKLIKILYIDPSVDEKSSSKMLEDSTAHLNYTCIFTVVPNAFIALECTEHTCYQLIITRKNLIDLHAVDMMKILDAVGASTPVAVLIERGEDYNPLEMQGLRLYLDVLRRPFCTADLCRVIQAAVDEMDNPRVRPMFVALPSSSTSTTTATTSAAVATGPQTQARSSQSKSQQQQQSQQANQPQHPPSKRAAPPMPPSAPNAATVSKSVAMAVNTSQSHPQSKKSTGNSSSSSMYTAPQSSNVNAMNSFPNGQNLMSMIGGGPYKSYGNTNNLLALFPTQDIMHQYDMHQSQSQSQHVLNSNDNHGRQSFPSYSNESHHSQHQQQQQQQLRHMKHSHVPLHQQSLHHNNQQYPSNNHNNSSVSSSKGSSSNGSVVSHGSNNPKTDELLRWKECIQVYSQELNASLSNMFQAVVSTESAGSLNGNQNQNQQHQQRSRLQSSQKRSNTNIANGNIHINTDAYDHHQAALGIASLGNSSMSMSHSHPPQQPQQQQHNPFSMMFHPNQQIQPPSTAGNEYAALLEHNLQHFHANNNQQPQTHHNHRASSDDGGTSTSSSVEDFVHTPAASTSFDDFASDRYQRQHQHQHHQSTTSSRKRSSSDM